MHSRLSVGAIAPAARKIIKRLSPERKLNNTEILREIIYQEGNKENCLERWRGREKDASLELANVKLRKIFLGGSRPLAPLLLLLLLLFSSYYSNLLILLLLN